MKWSRYNDLFQSQRNGWLLFNSASRNFLKIEDGELALIQKIAQDPEHADYSSFPMLYMQLRSMGFIVEDSADDDLCNIIRMRALTELYAPGNLLLTIAVTRACNFDCSYCFEGNRTGKPMSAEVEDQLIKFIGRFYTRDVSLTWFGGEPLLAFDRILSIDRRVRELGKRVTASMITNGFLLDDDKVSKLNDLNVSYLQITLDGKKETHDSRRFQKNGAPTYDKILENIDRVMASDFKGMVHIRVNVDARNDEEYYTVYKLMRERYPKDYGSRISVYPGFVKGDDHPDHSCFFEPIQQGEFIAKMVSKYGVSPLSLYPTRGHIGCTLTRRNAYVIGPDGEMYKCWDDVGLEEKVVGHISRFNDWNMALIAEGMTGCSYLDDPECRACYFCPVCNGGCHRIRQKNLHAEVKHSSCTYFKGNLENLLELYYEQKCLMAARS